jgi:tetratricopeptide (TPR) repeat protein
MKRYALNALFITIASIFSPAWADSIEEVSQGIHANGWFKSCNQALPRLSQLTEPSRESPSWKTYIKIKAGCLSELRRDSEAIAYLEMKYPDEDFDTEMLEYLATSHIRLGSFSDAAHFLEMALKLGPKSERLSDIHSRLALSYMQMASREPSAARSRIDLLFKAQVSQHRAIELNHSPSPMLYTQLGQIQTLTGDTKSAEKTLDIAHDMNTSYEWEKPGLRPVMEAEILMAKSHLKRLAGDQEGASILARKAIAVAPSESLKIVMAEIDSASGGAGDGSSGKRSKRSTQSSILSQPYIPLDEEI